MFSKVPCVYVMFYDTYICFHELPWGFCICYVETTFVLSVFVLFVMILNGLVMRGIDSCIWSCCGSFVFCWRFVRLLCFTTVLHCFVKIHMFLLSFASALYGFMNFHSALVYVIICCDCFCICLVMILWGLVIIFLRFIIAFFLQLFFVMLAFFVFMFYNSFAYFSKIPNVFGACCATVTMFLQIPIGICIFCYSFPLMLWFL